MSLRSSSSLGFVVVAALLHVPRWFFFSFWNYVLSRY